MKYTLFINCWYWLSVLKQMHASTKCLVLPFSTEAEKQQLSLLAWYLCPCSIFKIWKEFLQPGEEKEALGFSLVQPLEHTLTITFLPIGQKTLNAKEPSH